jgi:hypothetical protein
MKFQLRRLFWAFFLSGSCFLATYLWSRAQIKVVQNDGSERLAQVTFNSEDSRKKLSSSLQWLPLETGDFLFDGDTVRTSDRSEVQIHFNDGRSIKVDSNSTFVIQKTKDEISLDLKEGSVFVDAKSLTEVKASSNLVIVSDNSKLDLNGAKAQISKSKDKKTQLNIIEGKTQIRDQLGNVKDITSGQAVTLGSKDLQIKEEIRIISPSITKENDKTTLLYYIDPDTDSTVSFKWKGTPKVDESVLLIGESKNSLAEKEIIPPGKETVNTLLPPGTYYWQLVARVPGSKKNTYESSVYKLQVQSRFSVLVLAPKNDEVMLLDKQPVSVTLKWQKPASFKSLTLEVSKSPTMNTNMVVNNRNVSTVQDFTMQLNEDGEYYWRIATKYEDMERPIYTKIQKFRIAKKEPPKPPPTLSWLNTLEKQFYLDKPTITLNWDALTRKEEITKWKLEIVNAQAKSIVSRELTEMKFVNDQMVPGVYKATIEPFDKNGVSMGISLPKNIEITEMPLPKAPTISTQNLKRNQNTNKFYFENGVVNLQWDFQPVVKSYEVEIYSPVTNKVEKILSNKSFLQYSGSASGLNPGSYQVKVTPIDQHSRRGPSSESFEFEVPNFTTMSAPKLKNLNIKQSGQ